MGEKHDKKRLFVYNGGFLTDRRIRRILELAGWSTKIGKPGSGDWVGIWGKSPTAPRGEAVAEHLDRPILRVEDGFLRSVLPGRMGDPPMGLCLDKTGIHFDSSRPCDLETLLATHPLDDTVVLDRARNAIDRLKKAHLSKYNAFETTAPLPEAPYVLVIDQTRDDASIKYGGANANSFAEMLVFAQTDHPGSRVIIKSHPDTTNGNRQGHFGADVENDRVSILADPVSPWALMEGATAVYSVSSQLGFEAIFAGHRPRLFGQPFYAGWGLTQDEFPVQRRTRTLTRAQLFAAAMILYPIWYDPYRDTLCQLETVIDNLSAQSRAWRQDHNGHRARSMSRWKHRHIQAFFGQAKGVQFERGSKPAKTKNKAPSLMVWAMNEVPKESKNSETLLRIEDGFLRSIGLGAKLTPPLSLVADDLGLYYDPTRPSRLEAYINATAQLNQAELRRAENLIFRIKSLGLSKYNLGQTGHFDLTAGHRILVPGQVEDDMSIALGCGAVRTNLDLLRTVRSENPDAVIVYKPHPDVEAGLRKGAATARDVMEFADHILTDSDPISAIKACDAVWTMTSTLGFEALMHNKSVTCLGVPFYAGWGLSVDRMATPSRRTARPELRALVHAVLIDYPRYYDPVTKLACPVEVVVDRLTTGNINQFKSNGILSILQRLSVPFRRNGVR